MFLDIFSVLSQSNQTVFSGPARLKKEIGVVRGGGEV